MSQARPRYRPSLIRHWRKRQGLTLDQLVDRLQSVTLSAASLSRIERGEQPYSQPILEAVAEALGCRPSDLIAVRARRLVVEQSQHG